MKRINFYSALIIFPVIMNASYAQKQMACCSMSATGEFAMLGKDHDFAASHLSPLPHNYVPQKGKMIAIACADGTNARAFEVKSDAKTDKFLIMFHEWWGLNDYIKEEAEKYFHDLPGITVIAVDLYDGMVADHPDSAAAIMQSRDERRIRAIITGVSEYAGRKAKIQTIGWCFGGTWSLQAAMQMQLQAKGCVIYYGMPERDRKKLRLLTAPVLGIFAEKDQWITPEAVNRFEHNLKDLKINHAINRYDADHAFANPSNPHYHKVYAAQAREAAVAFLKKNFEIRSK